MKALMRIYCLKIIAGSLILFGLLGSSYVIVSAQVKGQEIAVQESSVDKGKDANAPLDKLEEALQEQKEIEKVKEKAEEVKIEAVTSKKEAELHQKAVELEKKKAEVKIKEAEVAKAAEESEDEPTETK